MIGPDNLSRAELEPTEWQPSHARVGLHYVLSVWPWADP